MKLSNGSDTYLYKPLLSAGRQIILLLLEVCCHHEQRRQNRSDTSDHKLRKQRKVYMFK